MEEEWPPYWPQPASEVHLQEVPRSPLEDDLARVSSNIVLATLSGAIYSMSRSFFLAARPPGPAPKPVKVQGTIWKSVKMNCRYSKSFGVAGLYYSLAETLLTKSRGRNDDANLVLSSVTAGVLHQGRRGLGRATLGGGAGLALGSVVALSQGRAPLWAQWTSAVKDFLNFLHL